MQLKEGVDFEVRGPLPLPGVVAGPAKVLGCTPEVHRSGVM